MTDLEVKEKVGRPGGDVKRTGCTFVGPGPECGALAVELELDSSIVC